MPSIYRRFCRAVIALVATAVAGCVTVGTIQTADTLGKHNYQFAAEASTQVNVDFRDPQFRAYVFPFPSMNFAARYGVGDAFDLGARIGSGGLEITSKFQLTDPNDKVHPVLSLAPSVGGLPASDDGPGAMVYGQIPLLIGFRLGTASQLILAPKIHDWIIFYGGAHSGESFNRLSVGSSLGLSLSLGKNLRLLPEVSVLYPFLVTSSGPGYSSTRRGQGLIFQGALGFLFGGP